MIPEPLSQKIYYMEIPPCNAALGAMGSLLRKLDSLLRITQAGPLNEKISLLNSLRVSTGQMKVLEVASVASLEPNYLFKVQLNAYLTKKVDELLRAEYSALSLRQLMDILENMCTKLEKLSVKYDPPLTAGYWMKDARELSYEMEDFVDKYFIHDDDAEAEDSISWMDEISGFKARAEEVVHRYDRYRLEYVLSDPTIQVSHRHRSLRPEETEPVVFIGREESINELLDWVEPKDNGEDDQQLKVVSILGVQGVGKTTLAKRLWHQLGEKFDCRAFVQAAKTPDISMVLRSVLTQVRLKQAPADYEPCEVANLIQCLRNYLQDKRYLVIVDDIWATSVWDVISCAFPEVNCCSIILTTTTIEDVALACCSYEPNHVFKIEPLGYYHSKKLFVDRAFGFGKQCPPQFNSVTDEITRKCGGLPLAIICIANLAANRPEPELVRHLDYMLNTLHHYLGTNSTSVEILGQVLNLCYSCLPQCLKTCLLYLSVYPENYLILKDDLVKQWIAEDFISTTEQDNVEAANCFFDELVSLGLIQRMDFIKELSYVVHPTVFEFIKCKSMEENFITIIDYHSQSTLALTDKIRRLSLHFGSATYATTPAGIGVWQVRSLTFLGLLNCMPSLADFKLARVVILHVLVDNGDKRFSLAEICKMLLLRYLQVRCNITVELPDKMGCLKHLETLDIHAAVQSVPSDIVQLPRLLHLHLGSKRDCYRKHRFLNYLPSGNARSLGESSSASSHHVTIYEFMGMIPRPPRWIGHFHNLRYLDAVLREIHTYEVDVLAELWALTVLFVYVRTPAAGGIHFKRAAFPALRHLIYKCGGVTLMNFERGAMPNLWRFGIGLNAHRDGEYGHMLAGIQHLLNLQEVSASIGVAFGADDSDRRAAESAFQDAISKHPCFPSFMVKRFDGVDGEYEASENNWVQEIEQHGAHKDTFSNNQLGVLGKMPERDMKKHADTSDDHHQAQMPKKALAFLLWLCLAILVATALYKVWVTTPWAVSGRTGATNTRTGIGFTRKYSLRVAMILDILGLMGAFLARSPWDIFFVTALAVGVLIHVMVAIKFSVNFRDLSPFVEEKAVSNRIENGMIAAPVIQYKWLRIMRKYLLQVVVLTTFIAFFAGQGLGLPSQCAMGKLLSHVSIDFVSSIVIIMLLLSMSWPGNKRRLRVTKVTIMVYQHGVLVFLLGTATCFATPLDLSLFTLSLYSPIGGEIIMAVSFFFCVVIMLISTGRVLEDID